MDPIHQYATAVLYAFRLHDGQVRKDRDQTPYIAHPLRVAERLRAHGVTDSDLLAAAVLHDTIEDCGTSYERLSAHFGERVAGLVAELTNDKRLPKAESKRQMLEDLPRHSAAARTVKLADRLDNLEDMEGSDWDLARRRDYVEESALLLSACRGVHPGLEQALEEAMARARRALA